VRNVKPLTLWTALVCAWGCGDAYSEEIAQLAHFDEVTEGERKEDAPPADLIEPGPDVQAPTPSTPEVTEAPVEEPVCQFKDQLLERGALRALDVDRETVPVSTAQSVTELDVGERGVMFLDGIECFSALTKLNIEHNAITNTTPLRALTGLTELIITDNTITDLSSVGTLTGLTKLHLHSNGVREPSPLGNLTQLVELRVGRNPLTPRGEAATEKTLEFLVPMTQLKTLDIGLVGSARAEMLPTMEQLERLTLRQEGLRDVQTLVRFVNLRYLSVDRNQIQDFTPLTALPYLSELGVTWNRFQNVEQFLQFQPPVTGERLSINAINNPIACDDALVTVVTELAERGIDLVTDCNP
jgi:Leucine-rich repeat (LRR) protein